MTLRANKLTHQTKTALDTLNDAVLAFASMRIIFIFKFLNQNKVYAPIIKSALDRGIQVECWLDQRDVGNSTKWYEFPSAEKFPSFGNRQPTFKSFKSPDQLAKMAEEVSEPCVIFAHHPPFIKKMQNQVWAHCVTSFYDSMAGMPSQKLNQFDHIFVNSELWKTKGLRYYLIAEANSQTSEILKQIESKMICSGATPYDHFALCNAVEIRKKFGIPEGKKVVTVFAFETSATFWSQRIFHEPRLLKRLFNVLVMPFSYPYVFSRIGLSKFLDLIYKSLKERFFFFCESFRCPSERDLLDAVSKRCKEMDYFFILKFRRKNPPKKFHGNCADLVILEDTEYFPYTSAQILSCTDVFITFFSSASAEAAYTGTPVLSITPPSLKWYFQDQNMLLYPEKNNNRAKAETTIFYNDDEGGVFNFSGLVEPCPLYEFSKRMKTMNIENLSIPAEAQRRFIETHVRPAGESAAQAIVDCCVKWLKASKGPDGVALLVK